jgi:hypothetical protein
MSQQLSIASNSEVAVPPCSETFPFASELSLAPLVAFWQQTMHPDHPVEGALALNVHQALQAAPALLAPITDGSVIAQHQELVDTLLRVIFPRASGDEVHAAALWPFYLRSFYATPAFARRLLAEDGCMRGRPNVEAALIAQIRIRYAYALVLERVYGLRVDFAYPLIYTATDPDTGLDCHFKALWNTRFVEVRTVGEIPPMTEALRTQLLANLGNTPALMAILPPEHFLLHGFLVLNALEVTDQEVLSSLKRDLIDRESLISTVRFHSLQAKLRPLLRRPALCFGLVALQGEQLWLLQGESEIAYQCIYADSQHYTMAELAGSVYERVFTHGELVLIEDLTTYTPRSTVEDALMQYGIRNLVVAPLRYQNTVIGALALLSPRPGSLHAMNTVKLQEVLPLFAMAVQRSMDELDTRIQAVIKEQCTAIHPAVEWRFRQAAIRWSEQRQRGALVEMEPIVFDEIYPLYGVSDIRGSSTHRHAAIQADLVAHLELARDILQLGYAYSPLPLLTALSFHACRHIARLEAGLGASEESTVLDFLRRDVEPVFSYLQTCGPEVRDKIDRYRATLNPRLGTLYQQRKDFEDSVMQLNETLAAYLDSEEDKAQGMIPHYFEQHKSDGIEYGIYVGASLLEHENFDMIHVYNLRLWQLLVTCGLTRQAARVKAQLKVPLDVAHLILVQHMPLAIRFRFDEKRFDIDGAYNMRYEIVKKRLDKALIKGSDERLTQPGKIAIVYSQPREALEYQGYIEYLQAAGELTEEVESLVLEDLPGAQGFHALRVTVVMQPPQSAPCDNAGERLDAALSATGGLTTAC